MNKLLVSLIVSFFLMLASGCSEQKKQPASAGSSQEQNVSGNETPTVPGSPAGADSDHVSGTTSPSSSNISGN